MIGLWVVRYIVVKLPPHRQDIKSPLITQQSYPCLQGPVVLVLTVLGSLARSPARKRREEDSPARLSLSAPVGRMSSVLVIISALSQV